jgi:3-oxoacyl-[acyl-carrier protein] reductase
MNILITGGSSGLGSSITQTLSRLHPSSKIYFTYNRSEEAARKIASSFSNAEPLHCDYSDVDSVHRLKEIIAKENIQVLVNNAIAAYTTNYFHKTAEESFLAGFQTNLLPVIGITQAFISHARKQKFGKIITILSAAIDNAPVGSSMYTAEKMYLYGLSKTWAKENISFNISANTVSPSFMKTTLHEGLDERVVEEMEKKHPLKKLLTTEEVAEVVQFLVTAPQHINGQNFRIGID